MGKRLTFTDGHGIGTLRLIGTRSIETFPLAQIKRVRLLKRADGYYVPVCGAGGSRTLPHEPTGHQVGIDMGLKVLLHRLGGDDGSQPALLAQGRSETEAVASARLPQSQAA